MNQVVQQVVVDEDDAAHKFPPFCFKTTYNYKVIDVNTRESILAGVSTDRIDVPPYCMMERGELDIQLQWRSALKKYYDIRRSVLLDTDGIKEFIGDTVFTVHVELLSYIEMKTTKEVTIGQ